jgi:sugar lactone lactonase YvrE
MIHRLLSRSSLLPLTLFWCAAAAAVEPQYLLGIAVAKDGMIYLADRKLPGVWLQKEEKLEPFFKGSKKFGTPLNAVRCLAIDKDGKLLAGDSATREVYRFDDAGQPQPLTQGDIGIPMSIGVFQSGDLVVADLELHKLWKVPAAGGKPEVFADVQAPRALAVDESDRVWVVSHGKDQLLRLNPSGKERQTIVAGRPFDFPSSVVVVEDAAFVCDTYAKTIWQVLPGTKPEKLAGVPKLTSPVGIARQGDRLLIVDPRESGIKQVELPAD